MEDNLKIVETVTPNIIYDDTEPVTVNIEVTNNTDAALTDITLTSDYSGVGTLNGTATLNGEPTADPKAGITIPSLAIGETATIVYTLTPAELTANRRATIVTTTDGAAAAAGAVVSDQVYISPFKRYASVSTSICTENIGCVEEVFVEKEPVRFQTTCDNVVITMGMFIGIKYESCTGKAKTARRHETVTFTVPERYFNEDTLQVNIDRICTSCREFAQCITVYLSASFPPA